MGATVKADLILSSLRTAVAATEVLLRHGLPADDLEPVRGGTVNDVWSTKQHVVRIGRAADHPREAHLANTAIEAGVRTARAVAWADGYSIWLRLPGRSISQPGSVSESVWKELLDDLERLHAQPLEANPSTPQKNEKVSASRLIEQSNERVRWTKSELDLLSGLLTSQPPERRMVFIHGDAYGGNVLVDEQGTYLALIDWGCAGWNSLEAECARLEDDALEIAKQRWGNEMDLGLLELLRLELLLQVLIQGRVGTEAVRKQLQIAAEYN